MIYFGRGYYQIIISTLLNVTFPQRKFEAEILLSPSSTKWSGVQGLMLTLPETSLWKSVHG